MCHIPIELFLDKHRTNPEIILSVQWLMSFCELSVTKHAKCLIVATVLYCQTRLLHVEDILIHTVIKPLRGGGGGGGEFFTLRYP